MINFKTSKGRFNHRAAAILIHDRHILLHRAEKDDFWSLPGGRVELLEPSEKTVERELFEELGIKVKAERLLWVVENFFYYNNEDFHELGFYYRVSMVGDKLLNLNKMYRGLENGAIELTFKWFALSALEDERIYPSFLKTELRNPPETTRHLVHYDS